MWYMWILLMWYMWAWRIRLDILKSVIHGLIGRGTEAGQDAERCEHLGLLGLTQDSTSMLPTRLHLQQLEMRL